MANFFSEEIIRLHILLTMIVFDRLSLSTIFGKPFGSYFRTTLKFSSSFHAKIDRQNEFVNYILSD